MINSGFGITNTSLSGDKQYIAIKSNEPSITYFFNSCKFKLKLRFSNENTINLIKKIGYLVLSLILVELIRDIIFTKPNFNVWIEILPSEPLEKKIKSFFSFLQILISRH